MQRRTNPVSEQVQDLVSDTLTCDSICQNGTKIVVRQIPNVCSVKYKFLSFGWLSLFHPFNFISGTLFAHFEKI